MKCRECGKYQSVSWTTVCLRCWLKSDEPSPEGLSLEIAEPEVRYPKFTLYMKPELEELLQDVKNAPQDSSLRDRAKRELGQYVYRVWDDMQVDED
jgi:hypothetical protein